MAQHDDDDDDIYWKIHKYSEISKPKNWHKHQPELITEPKTPTILWDFTIQTNRKIKSNRPDIVVKDYKRKTSLLIDMSVSIDK